MVGGGNVGGGQERGKGGRFSWRRRGGEGIRAIGPGEDGFEAPGADEGFGFGAGGHGGGVCGGGRTDGSTCDLNFAKGGELLCMWGQRNICEANLSKWQKHVVATTGTRTQTSSMGSSNSTLELLSRIEF